MDATRLAPSLSKIVCVPCMCKCCMHVVVGMQGMGAGDMAWWVVVGASRRRVPMPGRRAGLGIWRLVSGPLPRPPSALLKAVLGGQMIERSQTDRGVADKGGRAGTCDEQIDRRDLDLGKRDRQR